VPHGQTIDYSLNRWEARRLTWPWQRRVSNNHLELIRPDVGRRAWLFAGVKLAGQPGCSS
jgi:hypothetical protein